MSTAGYVLGIGDRHLGNHMLDLTDGGVVPIDFGCSFGKGLTLNVPELIPFRFTPQIEQAMKPLDTKDIFCRTMAHSLKAMSTKQSELLSVLEIFVKEPLLDWSKEVKSRQTTSSSSSSDDSESESESMTKESKKKEDWYPRRKVETVRMKLSRANPVALMIRDEMKGNLSRNARPIQKNLERI